jgi:dipeptidase D
VPEGEDIASLVGIPVGTDLPTLLAPELVDPTIDALTRKYEGLTLTVILERSEAGYAAFSPEVSSNIRGFMTSPQSGVYSWNEPGTVPHVSSNLGVMRTSDNRIEVMNMMRSDKTKSMEDRCVQIITSSAKYGFMPQMLTADDRMEPWEPVDSELGRMTMAVACEVYDKPVMRTVHAGLEAGIIQLKYPGMQAISIGPLIKGAHSTAERVDVVSVGNYYKLLQGMLARL